MLDLCMHTAGTFGASESLQLPIRVQLMDAVKHGVTPVHTRLNIPLNTPLVGLVCGLLIIPAPAIGDLLLFCN